MNLIYLRNAFVAILVLIFPHNYITCRIYEMVMLHFIIFITPCYISQNPSSMVNSTGKLTPEGDWGGGGGGGIRTSSKSRSP